MAATIYDVATTAGVSFQLASAVLGGKKYARASEATRKRIWDAARKLEYRSNMAASILAGGSSKLIGIILDSFSQYRILRLLQEIERLCYMQGYRFITSFTHENIAAMREDYHTLRRYGVCGFICCSHNYPKLKNEVVKLFSGAEDVVFLERPYVPKMPYIRTSRKKALTAMISDARKLGYRKIGVIHGLKNELTELTLHEEFLQAMADNGLKADKRLIFEFPRSASMPQIRIDAAMEKLVLPYRPDLLFIDDAVSALVLHNRLLKNGLNVTICGGNNDPLFQSTDVKSFNPDYEKMASELLNLLLHPEKRGEVPVVEAIYEEGSLR